MSMKAYPASNGMNKYVIISIIIGTVVMLGGLIWVGQPADSNDQDGSGTTFLLKSEEKLFDFGTISMAKGKVSHEFKVTNESDQPITLKKIHTSCMCTATNFILNQKKYGPFGMQGMGGGVTSANVTINPGESAMAEAIYDPAAHGPAGVGPIDRFIYLEDAFGGRLELEIKALVTP